MTGLRLLACLSALTLSLPAPARADLDPGERSAFSFKIVLRLAPNRLLTPFFREQLAADVRDQMQALVGDLADVDVITANDPAILKKQLPAGLDGLLKTVETGGLAALNASTGRVFAGKVHVVLLDCVDGEYRLQARQIDGLTGLASPVVRTATTADRASVALAAVGLIEQDFGPVGTVGKRDAADQKIDLRLYGGLLPADWARWVRKGDVFMVAAVTNRAGGFQGDRIESTFLQVEDPPADGRCVCRLWERQKNTLGPRPGLVGHRCIKLGTVAAPVKVRLVAKGPQSHPLTGLQVTLSRHGFNDASAEQHSTDRDGLVTSERSFPGLVFVGVSSNGKPVAQIPMAILGDRPLSAQVAVNPERDRLAQIEGLRDRWLRHLDDSLGMAAELTQTLKQTVEKSRTDALRDARAGAAALAADVKRLAEERASIETAAREDGVDPKNVSLTEGDRRTVRLRQQRESLDKFIGNVEKVVREEANPERQQLLARIEQAKLLEEQAEYGQAIGVYEAVIAGGVTDEGVKAHVDRLRAMWVPKTPPHRKAHDFIDKQWPGLTTTAAIAEAVPAAREALKACEAAKDHLIPHKLMYVAQNALLSRLQKRIADFNAATELTDDDKAEQARIPMVIDDLEALYKDAAAVVNKLRAARPGS